MAYGTVNADVIGTSVAGSNLGAGDASLMKNRIINGAMVIDQRNAGASFTQTTTTTYTLDRFAAQGTVASKYTVQQNAGSVTLPVGFTKYLGVTSSSAYSIGSGDAFTIQQSIEGFNIADLAWGTANAKTVTLSFQVYSSLTGTFGGSIRNGSLNRSYPFTYSIPVANTWTTISVTIAGDTTGTWATDNSTGINLVFGLGVGSTYSGTAGTWAATNYNSATGATSVVGTSGATFYITGVQLEVGSSATGFEYVNYQTSLANCQRYFQRISSQGVNYASFGCGGLITSNILYQPIYLLQTMRSAPSMSSTAANTFRVDSGNVVGTSIAFERITTNIFRINVSTAGLAGASGELHSDVTTLAYIDASAEL